MKRVYTLLSVAVLVAALGLPLSAQTITMQANIPFAFTVGSRSLPAGEYTIRNTGNPYVLMFQAEDGSAGALTLTKHETVIRTDDPAADTKLVFNRYGNQYFLSEVVDGYAATGFVVPTPKAEQELAKTASAQSHEVLATLAKR